MPWSRPALLTLPALCLSLSTLACNGVDQANGAGGDPGEIGDASWPSAPIPQPGGNGEPGSDNGSNSTSGGAGDTGDGDSDTDGWGGDGDPGEEWGDGDGDPGDGDGDPGDGDGDPGDGDGDPGDGDGDNELFECVHPKGDAVCDIVPEVCEALPWTEDLGPKPMVSPACCKDVDCGCVDGLCDLPACLPDDWCDCNCNPGEDPDCGPDDCAMPEEAPPELADGHEDTEDEAAPGCPVSDEPVVLYMSNDDSNSQASPIYVRQLIQSGYIVRPQNVRVHEFLNYYDLSYQNPEDEALDVGVQMRRTNAQTGEFTLLLSAQGRHIRSTERPALNLVFSLDLSGSMSGSPINRLKDTIAATAGQLRAGDKVTLIGWSTVQEVILDGYEVAGPNDPTLLEAAGNITTGGGTNLYDGLVSAYTFAQMHYIDGGINRVFLISDGGANAGVTATDLIAAQANDADGEGIYLVGVGVGEPGSYSDDLMDEVTDAGKGAYLYVDSQKEAKAMFGDAERFLANTTVVARNVQMELTMPWYFGIKEFHGEEYSADPAEVEPQHLAANDAMSFHQILQSCDPEAPRPSDKITARATYLDPLTLEQRSDEYTVSIGAATQGNAEQLYKGDVVVNYAKTFIAISAMLDAQQYADAIGTAVAMTGWLESAAEALDDPEVSEMAALMSQYADSLDNQYG